MAVESAQMANLNKMAAQKPAAPVSPGKVPKKFKGCTCPLSRCENNNCVCYKNKRLCTSECKCQECTNINGVRSGTGDSSTEPGQGCKCVVSNCRNLHCHCRKPSSGIEPEQADTSSMADLNKMAAPKPAASVSPRKVRGQVPKIFKGCTCPLSRCVNYNCVCYKRNCSCTSKCKCYRCENINGVRGSGSSTEPGQGGTGGASIVPDETAPPPNVEQEQTDDTGMARGPPQVEEQSRGNWGFDLKLLPSSNTEPEQEDTSGVTNVPDKAVHTTPPSNSESEQADDTSNMTVEPPWMENRGFNLNQLPSSNTEPEQEGTGGISNIPDEAVQTTPQSNSESEQTDDTSSMTVEPPRMKDRGNRGFDLNQLPASNTEPEQKGTSGVTSVPDEAVQTTPPPNSESEQVDDTSSTSAVEPSQMEEQSRGNRGFDLNKLPSSNTELAQADDTSSKDEEPAQGGEQDTESRDNRGLDQNKRRRSM